MESTHPGDHNNEKIKIGQNISVFRYYDLYVKKFALFSTIFPKAPSSEIKSTVNFSNFLVMESTHPGDHNNEKIKIIQTSQFSTITIFMLKILLF